MKRTSVPFSKTGFFSNLVLDYLDEKPTLKPLYKYPVSIEAFPRIIADKKGQNIDRKTLVNVLRDQYNDIVMKFAVKNNIDALLSENTFTIVTAHQPNLFLGPLYFLYKIASVINLAKQVQLKNPRYTIVPVYLMGSEDHDVAELAHISLLGKQIEWSPGQSGAFGRMTTNGLETAIDEIKGLWGNPADIENITLLLKKFYNGQNTIATATRLLVDSLFGKHGLVIVDGDDTRLKHLFKGVIEDELLNHRCENLVAPVVAGMEKNYTVQAKPRPINLFYLKDDLRSRIEQVDNNKWSVINSSITFSESELKKEIAAYPERFSPNVLMRSIYQEIILPNLAFVGGGAEVSYWLELKPLFEFYKVNYPMIVLRNSCAIIDKTLNSRIHKFGFTDEEIFQPADALIKKFIRNANAGELQLNGLRAKMEELFIGLKEKVIKVDPTLEASVLAEKSRVDKGLDNIEQKMLRAEKRKQEDAVHQITTLKEKLFPGNVLQERTENFFTFYQKYGDLLIDRIVENFNPLGKDFIILSE